MIGYFVVLTMVVIACVTVLIYLSQSHDAASTTWPEEKPLDE